MKDLKLCTDILLIVYISSIAFVPGGHRQFLIWFVDLIPMALMMIGFEPLIYTNLFVIVWCYSEKLKARMLMHVFHLAISFYLLTVGPEPLRVL